MDRTPFIDFDAIGRLTHSQYLGIRHIARIKMQDVLIFEVHIGQLQCLDRLAGEVEFPAN